MIIEKDFKRVQKLYLRLLMKDTIRKYDVYINGETYRDDEIINGLNYKLTFILEQANFIKRTLGVTVFTAEEIINYEKIIKNYYTNQL